MLSDIVMPGMGGEELVRVLGKHQPDVPIVLMTGYILNDEEVISHLPGVVCYLKKPLDASQVVQVLNQSLNIFALKEADRILYPFCLSDSVTSAKNLII